MIFLDQENTCDLFHPLPSPLYSIACDFEVACVPAQTEPAPWSTQAVTGMLACASCAAPVGCSGLDCGGCVLFSPYS